VAQPKIKTFEDACKALKLDPSKVLPSVEGLPNAGAIVAAAKLFIIAQALNGNWIPDWNDGDQYKYFPWFDMEKDQNNPSGFRLDDVTYNYAYSHVGSRLCFKSRDLAEYAATQFIDLYKDLMVL
jgi:hypothetical protein